MFDPIQNTRYFLIVQCFKLSIDKRMVIALKRLSVFFCISTTKLSAFQAIKSKSSTSNGSKNLNVRAGITSAGIPMSKSRCGSSSIILQIYHKVVPAAAQSYGYIGKRAASTRVIERKISRKPMSLGCLARCRPSVPIQDPIGLGPLAAWCLDRFLIG